MNVVVMFIPILHIHISVDLNYNIRASNVMCEGIDMKIMKHIGKSIVILVMFIGIYIGGISWIQYGIQFAFFGAGMLGVIAFGVSALLIELFKEL